MTTTAALIAEARRNGYTDPVVFTSTGNYGSGPQDEDDVYTVDEFRRYCQTDLFTDYDGSGHPVRERLANRKIDVWPSKLNRIPDDATHIVWYNR